MKTLGPWLAAIALAGCALDPGRPWGRLELTVEARASIPPDRLLPDGRFRTASEFIWKYEAFEFELTDARVQIASDAASLSFDPARPPPGYTLCHGGHCHATDGRLVDYAAIEAELLGGAGAAPVVLPLAATVAAVPAGKARVSAAPIDLSLGTVANIQVAWRRATVRARVWDGSPGGGRLPKDGVELQWTLPATAIAAQVRAVVGPGEKVGVRVPLIVDVPASWLDAVDPAAATPDPAALAAALLHAANATVAVERFD